MISGRSAKLGRMVDEAELLETGHAKSGSDTGNGVVFVRLLAPDCWALTADHRVFYIYRRQARRVQSHDASHEVRMLDRSGRWSPDKGIA
jgi:hypothetical protein